MRIGVGSPEKLAAAHLDNDRTLDTLKQAGLSAIADDPPSGDPPRKIPEESLPWSLKWLSKWVYLFHIIVYPFIPGDSYPKLFLKIF